MNLNEMVIELEKKVQFDLEMNMFVHICDGNCLFLNLLFKVMLMIRIVCILMVQDETIMNFIFN